MCSYVWGGGRGMRESIYFIHITPRLFLGILKKCGNILVFDLDLVCKTWTNWLSLTSCVSHGLYPLSKQTNFVYYEEIKRELQRILLYECRCNDRLKTKADWSTTSHIFRFFWIFLCFFFQQNKRGEGQGQELVTLRLWWLLKPMTAENKHSAILFIMKRENES